MTTGLKMVGLVRFSVLTPTYYSERFSNLRRTAAHLFSPDRMDLRFSIFETLCLPSLANQSDQDFDVVILTAKSMPEEYQKRLKGLLDPYPNIHFRAVGTRNHYRLLRQGYESIPTGGCSHRLLFRLDDDDAVDLEFVARTKGFAEGLLTMQTNDNGFVIAHNRGYYLRAGFEGAEVFDAIEQAPLSAGTSLVVPVSSTANPYKFNHRKLARHYNLYSDISVPAYIRTIHGDNKSDPTQTGLTHRETEEEIDQSLRRHFHLGLHELKAI